MEQPITKPRGRGRPRKTTAAPAQLPAAEPAQPAAPEPVAIAPAEVVQEPAPQPIAPPRKRRERKAPTAAAEGPVHQCSCHCPVHGHIATTTPPRPPRRAPAGPPSERQMAARKTFAEKVKEAKQLQAANTGLSYKDAMKRVYGKQAVGAAVAVA